MQNQEVQRLFQLLFFLLLSTRLYAHKRFMWSLALFVSKYDSSDSDCRLPDLIQVLTQVIFTLGLDFGQRYLIVRKKNVESSR